MCVGGGDFVSVTIGLSPEVCNFGFWVQATVEHVPRRSVLWLQT